MERRERWVRSTTEGFLPKGLPLALAGDTKLDEDYI
jgi:hypothetical protein